MTKKELFGYVLAGLLIITGQGISAMARTQDAKPAHSMDGPVAAVDPCKTGDEPCEMDQLKLQVQGLMIENSQLKQQLADSQQRLANLSIMANSNSGTEMVKELYARYGKDPAKEEFKLVDGKWKFVKREK